MATAKRILPLVLGLVLTLVLAGCSPTAPVTTDAGSQETGPVSAPETDPTDRETETPAVTEKALTEEEQQILRDRRARVLARMEEFVSVTWTPQETFTYSSSTRTFTFKQGQIYRGCPYAYGHGSRETFLDRAVSQDERGVYTVSFPSIDNAAAKWLFSDCSGTLWQAWSTVASSVSDRVATNLMTPANGFLRVGDYESDEAVYADTVRTCSENGTVRMFRAYAELKPGDAVVYRSSKGYGHVAMVKEILVAKNLQGEPDGSSYIVVMEQTSGNSNQKETPVFDAKLGQTVYLVGNTEHKLTFSSLFESGYLPITCLELIDPSAPVPEQSVIDPLKPEDVGIDTLFDGFVKTPFGISAVRIVITDAAGKTVQECIYYNNTGGLRSMNMSRLAIMPFLGERIDPAMLPAGQYHCLCEARTCSGDTVVFREFDFSR